MSTKKGARPTSNERAKLIIIIALLFGTLLGLNIWAFHKKIPSIPTSVGESLITDKQVTHVTEYISSFSNAQTFIITTKDNKVFSFIGLDTPQLRSEIKDSKAQYSLEIASRDEMTSIMMLVNMLFMFGIILLPAYIYIKKFMGSPAKIIDPKDNKVRFSDVEGQPLAKKRLQKLIDILENPDKYKALGITVPHGVLLSGPPGTGKTLLARALAGEVGIPFYAITGSSFQEFFAGASARKVRRVWQTAKKQKKGCIVFIDEFESLGAKRGNGAQSDVQTDKENTLNELLAQIDGVEGSHKVILIAATNRPDMLDDAILRPGRLDYQVTVDLPTENGRSAILALHSKKRPLADDVSFEKLAKTTAGFSGAQLTLMVNEAAITAFDKGLSKINLDCFMEARDTIIIGPVRDDIILSPPEKLILTVHEWGHAIIATLTNTENVEHITVIPRGKALGAVIQPTDTNQQTHSRHYYISKIMTILAGRAAEHVFISCQKHTLDHHLPNNLSLDLSEQKLQTIQSPRHQHTSTQEIDALPAQQVTDGAASDLIQATKIARFMVCELGMSKIGPGNFAPTPWENWKPSPDLLRQIDDAMIEILNDAYSRAFRQIAVSWDKYKHIIVKLQAEGHMSGDALRQMMAEADKKETSGLSE